LNASNDFFGSREAVSSETKETSKLASGIKRRITRELVGIIRKLTPTVNPYRGGILFHLDQATKHEFSTPLLPPILRCLPALGQQRFNWNAQPFRRCFAFFEHLDIQWRVIGHEGVDSNDMGSFRLRNIKRGLYRFAPGIGKAAVKRDMKNILEAEVKRLDEREISKAIEWLSGPGFSSKQIYQKFVYFSFVKNAAWPPDKETGFFEILDVSRWFHGGEGGLLYCIPLSSNQRARPRNRAGHANAES